MYPSTRFVDAEAEVNVSLQANVGMILLLITAVRLKVEQNQLVVEWQ
jgi:hypothetical protein